MTEDLKATTKQLLSGKTNYLGWSKVMNATLSIKKLIVKGVVQPGKDEEASNAILTAINLKIAGDLPDDDGPLKMLDWLKSRYGDDNRWDAESDLKNLSMLGIDPAAFLGDLDTGLARVKASGGSIDPDVMFKTLLSGFHQEFYQDYIRDQRKQHQGQITQEIYDSARKEMNVHYKATPAEIRDKYSGRKGNRANNARRAYEKRHCTICEEKNPSIMGTHDTEYHSERKPWTKHNVAGKAADEYKAKTAYYDSGANKHFFKYKPDQYQPYAKPTFVMTANGAKDPILGSGTISLGKLKLKDVQYVPNFVENLVSGVELMKKGYKTILESDKIVITKQGEEIASGKLCMNTDMIIIQEEAESGIDLCNSAVKGSAKGKCIQNLHEILGHCAKDTVRLTFDLSDQSSGELDCSICASTKTRQRNIPKIASNPPSALLEIIEMDLQGPFTVAGADGTRMNLKMIDSFSGYVKTVTILNKRADTILDAFIGFQNRLERRTGKKIISVRCDSGTEFDGSFVQYTASQGIIKQRGAPYAHHIPVKAERMHQTVLSCARAMLSQSLLPTKYYFDAILTASYLSNRLKQNANQPSPYELIYGKAPDLSMLVPFGCIGYAFVPPEKRTKLEQTREECRVLGYGDDDDTEERKGYKIIFSSDHMVQYSSDVTFPKETVFQPLELQNSYQEVVNCNMSDPLQEMFEDREYDMGGTTPPQDSTNTSDSMFIDDYIPVGIPRETPGVTNFISNPIYSDSEDERQEEIFSGVMTRQRQREQEQEQTGVVDEAVQEDLAARTQTNDNFYMANAANMNRTLGIFSTMSCYSANGITPQSYQEAIESPDREKWMEAMGKEMKASTTRRYLVLWRK